MISTRLSIGESKECYVHDLRNRKEPGVKSTRLFKLDRDWNDQCKTYQTESARNDKYKSYQMERARSDKYKTYQTGKSQE